MAKPATSSITTLRHETFNASETARRLIMLLDGSRNVLTLQHLMATIAAPAEVERLLRMFAEESLLLV